MAQLMLRQQAQGMEVSAIVHQEAGDFKIQAADWQGCTVHYVKSYGQLVYAPVAPAFGIRLLKVLRDVRPDIVHIHMPNLSAFWLLLLQPFLPESRWILHWHSDVIGAVPDTKVKLLYPFYRLFERWLLSKAEAVICTSPDYLRTSKPLQRYLSKCKVIPLGMDAHPRHPDVPSRHPDVPSRHPDVPSRHPDESQDLEKTAGQPNGFQLSEKDSGSEAGMTDVRHPELDSGSLPATSDPTLHLLCIGRLTYYKGHKYLLAAISQLVQRKVPVKLNIVGAGELRQQLQAYVQDSNLQNHVQFHNTVDEATKQQLIGQCDLLCLPSIERTEAFGVVLLEAAALAKPALVTDVPGSGMSYVVQDNQTGLIAKTADESSLADKLIWASKNKVALAEMGKQARLRQQQLFSIESVAEQIKRLYEG